MASGRAIAAVVPLVLAVSGCARLAGEACECAGYAHGAIFEDRCVCMSVARIGGRGPAPTLFFLDPDVADGGDGSQERPWNQLDWGAIDAALADGFVTVYISASEADGSEPEQLPERIDILRGDTGENRLTLDGSAFVNTDDDNPAWERASGTFHRARVPGILTPYEGVYSHITVRGFEVTGSKDKGVSWWAGDAVVLSDLHVHDNKGSPAIYLNYSNRSGHRSTSFRVEGCHVYNQPGECIYIGGGEGIDEVSHEEVVIRDNLVHHCRSPWDTKHDGINVKDGIQHVVVEGNVVYDVDWGIEVASPGIYRNNLVLDSDREGFQVSDFFAPVHDMVFVDNVVVRPGHDGVHIVADAEPATALTITGMTVLGARKAGLLVAGDAGTDVVVPEMAVFDSAVAFDGYQQGAAQVGACITGGNDLDADRALDDVSCASAAAPDWSRVEGPDGLWLTADDAIWVDGGALPPGVRQEEEE